MSVIQNVIIPPNSNWFAQSNCYCTPDNGLIYGATTKIVWIPSKKAENQEIKFLDLKKKLNCFAISPNWNESKRLAIINGDFQMLIYDFETKEIMQGHKGHCDELNKQYQFSSVTFTSSNVILSSLNSDIIKYCTLTNSYKSFPDFSNRNSITIMKTSPRDSNLVAAGTKNGLILLVDSEKMEVIARLRGQDTPITSLDFIMFPNEIQKEESKKTPIVDDSDLFDIYTYEKVENEFGGYQERPEDRSDDDETNEMPLQEKIHKTSDFKFLEACNNLRDQILSNGSNGSNGATGKNASTSRGTFEENKDQYGMKNKENPSVDLSIESNPSSHTPVLTEESLEYLDECQRMKDLSIAPKAEDENLILASGARECVVVLWDTNKHTVLNKIKWHPKAKNLLPAIFTNVLWMNRETLLITDNNGDIIEYKVTFDAKTKTLLPTRQKTIFDAKGALNFCKNSDSTLLWVSSIHRHICCLEVPEFKKIISLDTLQFRIHCIIENPIDSHVIAIGGNDKRLCLWNTSEVNHHDISLKPFMNKIQAGILSVSWHPEKDNILAFSTREGRIGVLDTNKFTNVPVVLESFTSHEIYSLSWAKFRDSKDTDIVILLACSNGKLVYYNSKDFKINRLEEFKQTCSIAVNENLVALGTNSGELIICDLSKNFKVILQTKICRKYVGMMSWQKNQLVIASEMGISLIKNINESTSEISDEDIIKFPIQKRVYSVRFNKAGDRLVSCCINGNVNVWDVESMKILSNFNIETSAYSAIFMPNNENLIICGGQDSTVHTFEWQKYSADDKVLEKVYKTEDKFKNVEWGAFAEMTTFSKRNKKRHTKKKIAQNTDSHLEISNALNKIISGKKNTSIIYYANREISSSPLDYIEMILSDMERAPSMNERMFGNRNDVKIMIEKEQFEARIFPSIIFPQLTDELKDDILKRIECKTLTELHISISPSVSYDLWRKCCQAFGNQCIENQDFIRAIPYLLAINDIDTCINNLCETKLFREAWIIAKMRKDDKDPAFSKIMEKWIAYLDLSGSYEIAAAILCINKDYKAAYEILDKRQNKDGKCTEMLKWISNRK